MWRRFPAVDFYDDYCATEQFIRVHRSAIVRLGAVRGIRRGERGGRLELVDGSMVEVSRSRPRTVVEALGGAR